MASAFRLIGAGSYQVAAYSAHGDLGLEAVVRVLDTARTLLSHVPYEMLTTGVEIVTSVDVSVPLSVTGGAEHRRFDMLEGKALSAITVAIMGAGSHRVWDSLNAPVSSTSPTIIYRYIHHDREVVEIDGSEWNVNDSPWPCAMGTPTFSNLEEALDRYTKLNRIPLQCAHLVSSWRDDERLAFAPKPEHLMRRSLILALQYALEGATVRPEQNQSETRPVDIEVTWWDSRRAAIIEIKWLGASGPTDRSKFTSTHPEKRALDGLKQLADYLDLRDGTTSEIPVMGYLYVFDARRLGLTASQTAISREDGLHFQFSDPPYPADLLARADMGSPYRCFLEPVI
ncbi:hypothetical protein [Frigoribacterium sp. CFBP 8751]|uniref:hypothetical protein n=1 Tax=Frigoribacterium sp. CFBP 8751 TaxID=2775277 RepID=UPI0017809A5D|nr:hypothetical protein [Frigoribacterium sp. CFBP 8751]MBD8538046.1 hypothetical protein [Frigoribacterium sp. CFBP 8751]